MAQHAIYKQVAATILSIPHNIKGNEFIIEHDRVINEQDEIGFIGHTGKFESESIVVSIIERRPAKGDWSASSFPHPDYIKLELV